MTVLIYEDEWVEVFFRDGPQETTLVTFNALGVFANGQRYWAQQIADRLNLRCVGIISREGNWFPQRGMEHCLSKVRPYLTGKIITYGCSMGGYGAIKYSAALTADTVLAFSPQFTISPVDYPNNGFVKYFQPDLHAAMQITAKDIAGELFCFYDDYHAQDTEHVRRIPAANIRALPVSFLRHDTNVIFNATARISQLFSACMARDTDLVKSAIRTAKRASGTTFINVAKHCAEHRKYVWALAFAAKAEQMRVDPGKLVPFYFELANALHTAGALPEASRLLGDVFSKYPRESAEQLKQGKRYPARQLSLEIAGSLELAEEKAS